MPRQDELALQRGYRHSSFRCGRSRGIIWTVGKPQSQYDRVRKLPKQFKPLKVYDAERRRGLAHTPEYDARMTALKEEFHRWLLAE
jgi:hypothetical protein